MIWLLLPVAYLAGVLTVAVWLAVAERDRRGGYITDRRREAA